MPLFPLKFLKVKARLSDNGVTEFIDKKSVAAKWRQRFSFCLRDKVLNISSKEQIPPVVDLPSMSSIRPCTAPQADEDVYLEDIDNDKESFERFIEDLFPSPASTCQTHTPSVEDILEPRPTPVFQPIFVWLPPTNLVTPTRDADSGHDETVSLVPASPKKSSSPVARLLLDDTTTTDSAIASPVETQFDQESSSFSSRSSCYSDVVVQRNLTVNAIATSPSHIIKSEINTIPFPRLSRAPHESRTTSSSVDSLAAAATALVVPVRPESTSVRKTRTSKSTAVAPRKVLAADMKVLRFLGEGTTGQVYHVEDTVTRARVALKVMQKEEKTEYTIDILLQERELTEKLSDCPWFVNLYCSFHDHKYLYMAMTVYPTDLDSELIKHEVFDHERARFYMVELIIALTALHSRGIIHRDVKAPNILIDREGHIVLADFGLSKDFGRRPSIAERVYQPYWAFLPTDTPAEMPLGREPEELHFVAWDYRGSELEMAPEIHLRQPYSFGVDFWSAGVVLFWMLTGRPPWYVEDEEDEKPLALKIIEDDLYWTESEDEDVDDVAKDFLVQMLQKDPSDRIMISLEMPRHPYFDGVDWNAMEERTVPVPWIPEEEVSHAYEPTLPTFVPGCPYVDEEDPYPAFSFVSPKAQACVENLEDSVAEIASTDDLAISLKEATPSVAAKVSNSDVQDISSTSPEPHHQSTDEEDLTVINTVPLGCATSDSSVKAGGRALAADINLKISGNDFVSDTISVPPSTSTGTSQNLCSTSPNPQSSLLSSLKSLSPVGSHSSSNSVEVMRYNRKCPSPDFSAIPRRSSLSTNATSFFDSFPSPPSRLASRVPRAARAALSQCSVLMSTLKKTTRKWRNRQPNERVRY